MSKLPGITDKQLIASLHKAALRLSGSEAVTTLCAMRMVDPQWFPFIRVKRLAQDYSVKSYGIASLAVSSCGFAVVVEPVCRAE